MTSTDAIHGDDAPPSTAADSAESQREYFVLAKGDKRRVLTNSPARFSWPAFVFGHFWSLYHRAWLVALLAWALFVAVSITDKSFGAASEELGLVDGVAVVVLYGCVLFGFQANRLLYMNLNAQGWTFIGTMLSANKKDARRAVSAFSPQADAVLPPPFPLGKSMFYALLPFVFLSLALACWLAVDIFVLGNE